MSSQHCPKCGQIDQVQKVSSVVSGGTSTGSYSGSSVAIGTPIGKGQTTLVSGHTSLSGGSQTVISQRLAPPPEPTSPSPGCFWYGLPLLTTGALLLCWFAPISKKAKARLVVLVGIALFAYLIIYSFLDVFVKTGEIGLGLTIIIAIGSTIAVVSSLIIYYQGLSEENNRKKTVYEEVEFPQWKRSIQKWNKLYYCARDDGVFDPDEGIFVPTDQMISYISRG